MEKMSGGGSASEREREENERGEKKEMKQGWTMEKEKGDERIDGERKELKGIEMEKGGEESIEQDFTLWDKKPRFQDSDNDEL